MLELDSTNNSGVWQLADRLANTKVICTRGVDAKQCDANQLDHRSRLMAKELRTCPVLGLRRDAATASD